MDLGPFGLNRLPNLHHELFLGQCPAAGRRNAGGYQPRLRGTFTYPEPFDRT